MKYTDIQRSIYTGINTHVPYTGNSTIDMKIIDTDIFFYIKGILFLEFFSTNS